MTKILQWCFILSSINLYGFEVNTHQALTRCATTTECGREGSKNLDRFVKNAEINTNRKYYKNEILNSLPSLLRGSVYESYAYDITMTLVCVPTEDG